MPTATADTGGDTNPDGQESGSASATVPQFTTEAAPATTQEAPALSSTLQLPSTAVFPPLTEASEPQNTQVPTASQSPAATSPNAGGGAAVASQSHGSLPSTVTGNSATQLVVAGGGFSANTNTSPISSRYEISHSACTNVRFRKTLVWLTEIQHFGCNRYLGPDDRAINSDTRWTNIIFRRCRRWGSRSK